MQLADRSQGGRDDTEDITVALEDDLDGRPADQTVRFWLDGPQYEIDLSTENAEAFRRKLAPHIDHARRRVGDSVGPAVPQ